jgi:hypothetical protein
MPPFGRSFSRSGNPVHLLVAALRRRGQLLSLSSRLSPGDVESVAAVVLTPDDPPTWPSGSNRAGLIILRRTVRQGLIGMWTRSQVADATSILSCRCECGRSRCAWSVWAVHAEVGSEGLGRRIRPFDDVEPGALEHRLQQPGVGAVLAADVRGELLRGPALRRVGRSCGQPGIEPGGRRGRVEGVDQVRRSSRPPGRRIAAMRPSAMLFQKSGSWCSALRE